MVLPITAVPLIRPPGATPAVANGPGVCTVPRGFGRTRALSNAAFADVTKVHAYFGHLDAAFRILESQLNDWSGNPWDRLEDRELFLPMMRSVRADPRMGSAILKKSCIITV